MKYLLFVALGFALIPTAVSAGEPVKKKSAREAVFTRLFNEANTDGNAFLDEQEFARSYGASPRPVVTEYRFNALASSVPVSRGVETFERGILLGDFIDAKGGRKLNPSKEDIFVLADKNGDGVIDYFEFPATRIQKTAVRGSIFDSFDKLDVNDDALITTVEWGFPSST